MKRLSPLAIVVALALSTSTLPACDSPYRFTPLEQNTTALTPDTGTTASSDAGVVPVPDRRATLLEDLQPGDNSYTCACKILVPVRCVNSFVCGLPATGTWPAGDFCDLGIRESSICFPVPFTTVEQAEADCSGRVRSAVMLGIRWAFSSCRGGGSHCQIRIQCTSLDVNGRVRTARIDRCNDCWPAPLASDLSNARVATYVPRNLQLLCSESEIQLSSSEQNICGQVGF